MKPLKKAKIALVCDWLTTAGGAEKVILGFHKLFPTAPIYTLLYEKNKIKGFENAEIITSKLQKIPILRHHHNLLLQFMPTEFESFNLSDYDIIISSSHSCAKGILVKPHSLHICYCHSPMRYAWDNPHKYIREYSTTGFVKKLAPFLIHKIRIWDKVTADRVDHFIANSNYIGKRIEKFYKRKSVTIHPFINPDDFYQMEQENFYLGVGRLTAYKKFDLIVDAFNKNGLPIKIAGTGNMENILRKKANKNIEFLGYISDDELHKLYATAKALIFPQKEDFGIIPLEAMASGCPVIAYNGGGALETVVQGKTGILFNEQNIDSLNNAIEQFTKNKFDREKIVKHARNFSQERFNREFLNYLDKVWQKHQLTILNDNY